MIALIAGTGALPGILLGRLRARGEPVVLAALEGTRTELPDASWSDTTLPALTLPALTFRLEHLGSFLVRLRDLGATRVCFAGGIRRPRIDACAIDAATAPLVPRLAAALGQGDDGALRIVLEIFEEAGLAVVGAHQIAPDLLPPQGMACGAVTPGLEGDAMAGALHLADMGRRDVGQACVIRAGAVLAEEGPEGTDAMLAALRGGEGAILFKGPKPGQDRRVDLPVIGPDTAARAAAQGLTAIVIEAGGVMVLHRDEVVAACAAAGLTLWVRTP